MLLTKEADRTIYHIQVSKYIHTQDANAVLQQTSP